MLFNSILTQMSNLLDKLNASASNTEDIFENVYPFFSAIEDDSPEVGNYINITQEDSEVFENCTGYIISHSVNNNKVVFQHPTLGLIATTGTHQTVQTEDGPKDYDVICCHDFVHKSVTTLMTKQWNVGAGEYIMRYYPKALINNKGEIVNMTSLLDGIVDGWVENSIISCGVKSLINNIPNGLCWNNENVNQFTTEFNNAINQKVDFTKLSCADAKSTYYNFIESAQNGPTGVINYIKTLYSVLNTAEDDDGSVTFINNNDFASQSFLTGTLNAVFSTVSQVASAIIAVASPVLGVITSIISAVSKVVVNALNYDISQLTYAAHENDGYLMDDELPCGLYHEVITSSSQYYSDFYDTLLPYFNEYGMLRVKVPGAICYMWLGDNNDINLQARPDIETQFSIFDIPNFAEKSDIVGSFYNSIILTRDVHFIESLCSAYSTKLSLSDGMPSGTSNDIDKECKRRLAGTLNIWFSLYLNEMLMDTVSGTYTARVSTSSPIDALAFNAAWLNEDPSIFSASAVNLTWDQLIDDSNSGAYIGLLYNSSFSEYFGRALSKLLYEALINHLQDCVTITSCNKIYNKTAITLPKYERGNVIRTILIVGMATVALTVVSAISFFKIKKAINNRRATLSANAESSWEDFKNNPTSNNYRQYRKNVRKNNRFAKRFGGTQYSKDGFWASTNDSQSLMDNLCDSLYSAVDNGNTLNDPIGVETVIKLIGPSRI